MATMLKLVGGTWTTEGKFVAQFRYVKTNKGKGIRGIGVIGKGTPQAMESVSMFGWDPGKKSVYYIDFHGHDTVYKGNITTVGKELQFDFTGIVGDEGVYRSSMELTDRDTMVSSLYGKKDGEWVNVHSLTFKRTK